MGRMVHGTNGLHVVRIVNGTKSPDTVEVSQRDDCQHRSLLGIKPRSDAAVHLPIALAARHINKEALIDFRRRCAVLFFAALMNSLLIDRLTPTFLAC